ncbi:hypothetical protein M405DRAFT_829236 [Rhizopogon salebrosus TDB-379]|nr:hypothetical protein M405DRAFT_829236 [Rhizopogon salebrosus TDB-379]
MLAELARPLHSRPHDYHHIINEPTAAAIVYGLNRKVDGRECEQWAHPCSSLILVEELLMFLS